MIAYMSERRSYRVALWVVPAVVFLGLLAWGLTGASGPPGPGDDAPAFSAPTLDGETLALDDLEGRPVLLNFWASWCVPCEDEAPMLRRAVARYGDRVAFVGINIRDARSDATEFVDRYRLDYPHVRDDALTIYSDYGLTGQPESFLIDAGGRIVEHVPGAFASESDLFALLDEVTTGG
jgi:cytochrome c biogenesis protein CcmG, thiol:disulfide interchange protein DsbE